MDKFVLNAENQGEVCTCNIQSREDLLSEAFGLLCQLSDEQLRKVMEAVLLSQ